MYNKPILKTGNLNGSIYFIDHTHPLRSTVALVYMHRHVASLKIGRWVTKDEVVHHIDHNRDNNAPSNLEVTTRSKHAKDHASERNAPIKPRVCTQCNKSFFPDKNSCVAKYCSWGCAHVGNRKVSDEAFLSAYKEERSVNAIGKRLGISWHAVNKKLKRLGLPHADARFKK